MKAPYVYPKNAGSDEYRKKLEFIDELGINPFAQKYLTDPRFDQKEIIFETKHWSVFSNQHKYKDVEHQFVFVSKEESETLWELSPAAYLNLRATIKAVCRKNKIEGGGIVSRFGLPNKSGATVKHLHVQLLVPRDRCAIAAWFGSKEN
jgi:diadenosine tetraphosphate (Ap4A) HIT family hydrolase